MEWILTNGGNILVSLILVGIVIWAIRKMIRDKRMGKTSCGGDCSHCAMSRDCHSKTPD